MGVERFHRKKGDTVDLNITEVGLERVFNLGNYETFKVKIIATVSKTQLAEDVLLALDEYTLRVRNKHRGETYGKEG